MREPSRPILWNHLIQQSDLSQIQKQCEKLEQLTHWVQHCLSEPLKNQVKVVCYTQSILKLEVISSAVLMRLKYEQSQLMLQLRQHYLPELASISCQINPKLSNVNAEKLKQWQNRKIKTEEIKGMSKAISQLLFDLANDIENDALKKALLDLAQLKKEPL